MTRGPDWIMRRLYIVAVEGNVVRLAVDAPGDVEILREELMTPAARVEWNNQSRKAQMGRHSTTA